MYFCVSRDDFARLAAADPRYSDFTKDWTPFERTGFSDLTSAFISIVLSQQVSAASYQKQLAKIPENAQHDPELFLKFIAQKDCPLRISANKLTALSGVCTDIASGLLADKMLLGKSLKELYDLLLPYKGIGPWSVEMLAIFYLGLPDVFAITDYGVRMGFARFLGIAGGDLTKELLQEHQKRISPYGTLASLVMWHGQELGLEAELKARIETKAKTKIMIKAKSS